MRMELPPQTHASTDAAAAVEAMNPPFPTAEPCCAECGHGALAHALIGIGTCTGVALSWHERVPQPCPCVRYAFGGPYHLDPDDGRAPAP